MDELLKAVEPAVRRALAEDLGDGDVTSETILPAGLGGRGHFLAKADGVVAGLGVVELTFALLSDEVTFTTHVQDGQRVTKGAVLAEAVGPARALLSGERVALNFLQRMSGIATLTRRFVDAVQGSQAVILDTRKTAPGLRLIDKWAVRLGGGQNHRLGLFDMVLIKDNHIVAAGGITPAVERVRAGDKRGRPIEVEVKNLAELDEALALRVDRIMLDNMSPAQMRTAVQRTAGRVPLEASGNVSPETITAVAATGVDYISIGMLTHSVRAMDVSFELETL